jgi:hypothetical protein
MLNMKGSVALLGVFAVLFGAAPASLADVTITPRSGGLSSVSVAPGGSFSVELLTTGSGSFDSAVFTVEFSKAGLELVSYSWRGSFNGSGFDGSIPSSASLPVTIGDMTYDTPGAVEKLDIYFDNFAFNSFPVGIAFPLLTLNFNVPSGFAYGAPPEVLLSVVPDTFANGGIPMGAQGGQFTVTPELGTMTLLGLGAVAILRLRRKTAQAQMHL